MRWVVFLRGANVGKHNRFQPAILAKELAKFGVVSIGAVGTFVVREDVSESALRAALAQKLPFKCEVMICSAKAILDLANENPFAGEQTENLEAYVTVMLKRPAQVPQLPIYAPVKEKWEIKILRVVGTAVLSLRRRTKDGRFYPNEIVEKKFGVASTTRNWNTIVKVGRILQNG
jgi:Uncharacterized protein conserved in bacteria